MGWAATAAFARPPPAHRPLLAATPPRSAKLDGPYDNRLLPVVLTVVLMTFLTTVWIGSIVSYEEAGSG